MYAGAIQFKKVKLTSFIKDTRFALAGQYMR